MRENEKGESGCEEQNNTFDLALVLDFNGNPALSGARLEVLTDRSRALALAQRRVLLESTFCIVVSQKGACVS